MNKVLFYYYYYYYYYCYYYYYYYYYHKAMCKWPILPIQYCWANNVGSCCICVGIGVQMEATTPNDLEYIMGIDYDSVAFVLSLF